MVRSIAGPWGLRCWYRLRGRELGVGDRDTGAVIMAQRFGSALNLNVHVHMLPLDGVFVEDGGTVRWVNVPAPTTQEVQQRVTDLARPVETWLDTQGYPSDDPCDQDDAPNRILLAAQVAGRTALGTRAGARVRRLQRAATRPLRLATLCGEAHGYNLPAVVMRRGRSGVPAAVVVGGRGGQPLVVRTACVPWGGGPRGVVVEVVPGWRSSVVALEWADATAVRRRRGRSPLAR